MDFLTVLFDVVLVGSVVWLAIGFVMFCGQSKVEIEVGEESVEEVLDFEVEEWQEPLVLDEEVSFGEAPALLPEVEAEVKVEDLLGLTRDQLRVRAKAIALPRWSRLSKCELVEALRVCKREEIVI